MLFSLSIFLPDICKQTSPDKISCPKSIIKAQQTNLFSASSPNIGFSSMRFSSSRARNFSRLRFLSFSFKKADFLFPEKHPSANYFPMQIFLATFPEHSALAATKKSNRVYPNISDEGKANSSNFSPNDDNTNYIMAIKRF